MECAGWTDFQGFALRVGIVLALYRVDGWVIICSFLVRFWVSFWYFVYFMSTSFIFTHAELYWEFTMLGLIIETFISGNGRAAAIGLHESVTSNL
jgi:hypothetical protein